MTALMSAAGLVAWLESQQDVIGTGEEPDGLCGNREDHRPHLHDSATLGRFWCTADQDQREPYRSERRRRELSEGPPRVPPAAATTPSLTLPEVSSRDPGGTGSEVPPGEGERP